MNCAPYKTTVDYSKRSRQVPGYAPGTTRPRHNPGGDKFYVYFYPQHLRYGAPIKNEGWGWKRYEEIGMYP